MSDPQETVGLNDDASYFPELQTETGWGRVLRRFIDWSAPQPGWRTLDVGCGPALLPLLFAQKDCHAFGIDHDPAMFRPAPLHPAVVLASGEAPPFPDASFDLVTCSNVLFYHPRPAELLRSLKRLLRRDGYITMINPSDYLSLQSVGRLVRAMKLKGLTRASLLNYAQRAENHNRWTASETAVLLESSGFTLVDTKLTMGPGFVRFTRAKLHQEVNDAGI